jgi:hypothetical protein
VHHSSSPVSLPFYDGRYTLTSVEHEFEKDAGYTTSVEASTDPMRGKNEGRTWARPGHGSCAAGHAAGALHWRQAAARQAHHRAYRGDAAPLLCRAVRRHGRSVLPPEDAAGRRGDQRPQWRSGEPVPHSAAALCLFHRLHALRADLAARIRTAHPDRPRNAHRSRTRRPFPHLQRTGFGGKVTGQTFGVSPYEPGPFNVLRLASYLEAVHERLAGVVIESLPYAEFIARYDRPETLFYLDPPYCGSEHYYGRGMFTREEFEKMAALLATLKGRFILSLNDVDEVRRTFAQLRY